jgi:hypothetical protein
MDDNSKDTHQKLMETTLKEWGAKMDALKGQAEKASAEAKVTLQKQIEEFGKLQESALKHLDELRATSNKAFHEAKADAEQKWTQLTSAVEAFWTKLKS